VSYPDVGCRDGDGVSLKLSTGKVSTEPAEWRSAEEASVSDDEKNRRLPPRRFRVGFSDVVFGTPKPTPEEEARRYGESFKAEEERMGGYATEWMEPTDWEKFAARKTRAEVEDQRERCSHPLPQRRVGAGPYGAGIVTCLQCGLVVPCPHESVDMIRSMSTYSRVQTVRCASCKVALGEVTDEMLADLGPEAVAREMRRRIWKDGTFPKWPEAKKKSDFTPFIFPSVQTPVPQVSPAKPTRKLAEPQAPRPRAPAVQDDEV